MNFSCFLPEVYIDNYQIFSGMFSVPFILVTFSYIRVYTVYSPINSHNLPSKSIICLLSIWGDLLNLIAHIVQTPRRFTLRICDITQSLKVRYLLRSVSKIYIEQAPLCLFGTISLFLSYHFNSSKVTLIISILALLA